MPVIINHKICDQSNACGGIGACPVGAFTYNDKTDDITKRIHVDNSKCVSCGACEKTCPIGAIGFAKTWEEYEELKKAIEEDPRCSDDLFVDRFGADIINQDVQIEADELDNTITKSDKVLIELFVDDSIMCLLKSIPYHEILENSNYTKYFRCNVGDADVSKYKVKEFPCLLLCNNGKVTKVVNGYFEEKDKQKLFDRLK